MSEFAFSAASIRGLGNKERVGPTSNKEDRIHNEYKTLQETRAQGRSIVQEQLVGVAVGGATTGTSLWTWSKRVCVRLCLGRESNILLLSLTLEIDLDS